MAKRQSPINSERPVQSVTGKRQVILKLNRRIDELKDFDPKSVSSRFSDPQVVAIQAAIKETLSTAFGHGTVEYNRYVSAARLDNGPIIANSSWVFPNEEIDDRQLKEAHRYLSEGKARSIALLKQAIQSLEEEIEFEMPSLTSDRPDNISNSVEISRRVFIVHGHDEGVREAVARYLEQMGFEAIILHERANQSRTVIEKVETYGNVDFAVVLLTPDDQGCKIGEALEPRVRQNVLLELGYFIGKLGRSKVCVLVRGDVTIPSDFCGVMAERIDQNGGWRQTLARELQAAGHEVDWNRVMR